MKGLGNPVEILEHIPRSVSCGRRCDLAYENCVELPHALTHLQASQITKT